MSLGFRVLLLGAPKKRTLEFPTEEQLVAYLKATRHTEAPLAIQYADGSLVKADVLNRIHARLFDSIDPSP